MEGTGTGERKRKLRNFVVTLEEEDQKTGKPRVLIVAAESFGVTANSGALEFFRGGSACMALAQGEWRQVEEMEEEGGGGK